MKKKIKYSGIKTSNKDIKELYYIKKDSFIKDFNNKYKSLFSSLKEKEKNDPKSILESDFSLVTINNLRKQAIEETNEFKTEVSVRLNTLAVIKVAFDKVFIMSIDTDVKFLINLTEEKDITDAIKDNRLFSILQYAGFSLISNTLANISAVDQELPLILDLNVPNNTDNSVN